MTPRGIASLLGASQRDSCRFFKEIRELGYIEDRPPAARLSPDAFYRGELRHPPPGCFYTRLYAAGADGLYGTDAFRYLPAIIPYLHRTLNVLCENPCEMDQEKIQVLTWAAVCARAGYSPR